MGELRLEAVLSRAFTILNARNIGLEDVSYGQIRRSVRAYCRAAEHHDIDFEQFFLRDIAEQMAARHELMTDIPSLGNEPVRPGRRRRMIPRDRAVGEEVARRQLAEQAAYRLIG